MKFSILTQSFYGDGIDFGSSLPVDAVEITKGQAELLYPSVNNGCYVYISGDVLTPSPAPPDEYHSWDTVNNCWVMTDDAAEQKKRDISALAEQKKTTLRLEADSNIAWRQDAVDAGVAKEEESAALLEWKKYRVLLMRVDTTAPDWPVSPGELES